MSNDPDFNPAESGNQPIYLALGIIAGVLLIVSTPLRGYFSFLQADDPTPRQVVIATLESFECGVDTVEDADGNSYNTVAIGDQCWMAENLRVGTTINGSTNQTDNATIERWCYNNSDANCDDNLNPNNSDGGLYQWDEAMQYSTTEGAQGICPAGWHIPSDQDFKDLEIFLGMTPAQVDGTGDRGTDQGTQLKPNGSSGFEGNFAGLYTSNFVNRTTLGYWWSSSETGVLKAFYRYVLSSSAQVVRNAYIPSVGLSVRCLED
jgi:uncharacterized protein (TIGR02145 family)